MILGGLVVPGIKLESDTSHNPFLATKTNPGPI